jgi:4-hydroxymandelate oxidase
MHKLAHPDGELASVRAAGKAGVLAVMSTFGSYSMEEIAAAATGPRFFQLYWYKDKGLTDGLIARARKAKYQALVLTADAPVLGRRERDVRNNFAPPPGVTMRNFETKESSELTVVAGSSLSSYVSAQIDPNLTWKNVEWLAHHSKLPVLVKGIIHPDDARLAAEHGAVGVVVSNHGGRQLDGALSGIDALPDVVATASLYNLTVIVDGGFRRGTDVLKALALGAHLVLIGRPVIWGLAVNGEAGVTAVLDLLRTEFDAAMAMAGCPDIASIPRDLVTHN